MKEFTFYNPTRIEFGSGKEDTIGAHIASAGARKVLLCYGSERIKREGLFDTVSQNLADNGIEYIELGGIVSKSRLHLRLQHQKRLSMTPLPMNALDHPRMAYHRFPQRSWEICSGPG